MCFKWPNTFERIPSDPWVETQVESLALNYDTVENHGWYANLDHTVDVLSGSVQSGDIIVDYSGGTGILTDRLLDRLGSKDFGVIIVDSSPKFLRLALEKFRDEPRVAFRNIRFLRDEGRLEHVDEVLGTEMCDRRVDFVVSTNAIHLYFDLLQTIRAWHHILRPGGQVLIQSGNIRTPNLPADDWIIDETVEVIHRRAIEIVRDEDCFRKYRPALEDAGNMSAHDTLRKKYFLPVRSLDYYLEALRSAGFEVIGVSNRRIPAIVSEWYDFLSVYHEGVLGWVGGAEKIVGVRASDGVISDRLTLMRLAMKRVFDGGSEFGALWTYIHCKPMA